MEWNSTVCCSNDLPHCPWVECEKEYVDLFIKTVAGQMWRVDALLLVNVILAGVIVGIGAYGNRYRHYGFTRYLLLGATTLFLPIISSVLSTIGSNHNVTVVTLQATCTPYFLHPYLVIVSTGLVLISAINTSPIVATDDRENRSIRPPIELLVQGIWIAYLAATVQLSPYVIPGTTHLRYFMFAPFALVHAKLALKYYAFIKARKSFALGRNPRLIIGYMQQLREGSDQHGESMAEGEEGANVPPPPLLVMGEDDRQVEKQPNGYIFRNNLEAVQGAGLVTIDRLWQLDNMLLMSMPQLKDLCLSFALFKLLRCRFARYKLTDDVIPTKTVKFVKSVLIMDGEHERAFRMIADELSFLHDYYYSPLPISYSVYQVTIFSMLISVLSIGYCILSGMDVIRLAYFLMERDEYVNQPSSIHCDYICHNGIFSSGVESKSFGRSDYDLVPVLLLFLLVVVAEARNIASHICSSWTKVILTCRCVHRASLGLSPVVPKWVGCLLQCRCNRLMRHWNDKMGQNLMLVLQPKQFHQLVFPRSILNLFEPQPWKNNVKIPSAVKACIIATLRSTSRSNEAGLSKGMTSLRHSQVGESLLWSCNNSKGTTDTILVWHIATAILEVRHPHHPQDGRPSSSTSDDKKTAATHLSRYCAYLVAFYPELLPDDDGWSKGLYKLVKKDVERALAPGGGTGVSLSSMPPEAGYRQLIELLGARQNHQVLKDAAKLAEQLGELATGGEEIAWKLLAGFWSEMVLYLAPSDNTKGHMEAVDRGGELITLLWALLTHVGIVDRPESAAASASSS